MVDSRPSSQGHFSISIEIEGPNLQNLEQEAGGHRLQRIPPTEKRGRVHTSTVTVAVTDFADAVFTKISESDIKIEWYSGSGAGGQHRNKHANSARVTHLPTGIVCTAQTRSRENSLKQAMAALSAQLQHQYQNASHEAYSLVKRQQVGSGQRGDKIRTIRLQDNRVIDHRSGKKMNADDYMDGYMDKIW